VRRSRSAQTSITNTASSSSSIASIDGRDPNPSTSSIIIAPIDRSSSYGINLKLLKSEALVKVQRDGNELRHVDDKLKRDREVVLAAVRGNGEALMYASLGNFRDDNVKKKIKDAAKEKWPEGNDDDGDGRLVCHFLGLSGEAIEEADAWDKNTYELTDLFRERGIITTRQSVSFVDDGGHTFTKSTKQRRMPRLTMVGLNAWKMMMLTGVNEGRKEGRSERRTEQLKSLQR
jgi:hypothetical protein